MSDFVQGLGIAFLPHLLIRLADRLVAGADEAHKALGIGTPTRTTSTLLLLHRKGPKAVTEIARELRQSHQLVMVWIEELKRLALIATAKDPADGRRTIVSLTAGGKAHIARLEAFIAAEARVFEGLMEEADAQVFEALWRLEKALRERPYGERLRQELKPGT